MAANNWKADHVEEKKDDDTISRVHQFEDSWEEYFKDMSVGDFNTIWSESQYT